VLIKAKLVYYEFKGGGLRRRGWTQACAGRPERGFARVGLDDSGHSAVSLSVRACTSFSAVSRISSGVYFSKIASVMLSGLMWFCLRIFSSNHQRRRVPGSPGCNRATGLREKQDCAFFVL
jgi:hypothetical protein